MDHFGAAAVTARRVVPGTVSVLPKPNLKSVEESPVRIIRIDRDPLVVPVLVVIASTAGAVRESRSSRAWNLRPGRTTVCAAPRAKFTARPATTRLRLDCL